MVRTISFPLVLVLGLATFLLNRPVDWETVRYRVTVHVEQSDKVYTGSAVREIAFTKQDGYAKGIGYRLSGEAIVIDRGEGQRRLFVLLKDFYTRTGLRTIFEPQRIRRCFGINTSPEVVVEQLRAVPIGRRCDHFMAKRGGRQPLVVSFIDETELTSIYPINGPWTSQIGLVAATLAHISYERVDPKTPLTRTILKELPALAHHIKQPKKSIAFAPYTGPTPSPFAALISDPDFRR